MEAEKRLKSSRRQRSCYGSEKIRSPIITKILWNLRNKNNVVEITSMVAEKGQNLNELNSTQSNDNGENNKYVNVTVAETP